VVGGGVRGRLRVLQRHPSGRGCTEAGDAAELPAHRERTDRPAQDAVPRQRPLRRERRLRAGFREGRRPAAIWYRLRDREPGRPGRDCGRLLARVARAGQAVQPADPGGGAELPGDPERNRIAGRELGLALQRLRPPDQAHVLGGARVRVDAHAEPVHVLPAEPAAELLRLQILGLRGFLRSPLRPLRRGVHRERSRGVPARVSLRCDPGRCVERTLHPEHQRRGHGRFHQQGAEPRAPAEERLRVDSAGSSSARRATWCGRATPGSGT
jgi:hypothetical protein